MTQRQGASALKQLAIGLAGLLIVSQAQAFQTFQSELRHNLELERGSPYFGDSEDRVSLQIQTRLYGAPLDNYRGPSAEAAFIHRASSAFLNVNLSSNRESDIRLPDGRYQRRGRYEDSRDVGGGIDYYTQYLPLYFGYEFRTLSMADHYYPGGRQITQQESHVFSFGLRPTDELFLGTRVYLGDGPRDALNFHGKYLPLFYDDRALNLEWDYHYHRGDQRLALAADWYFTRQFSLGLTTRYEAIDEPTVEDISHRGFDRAGVRVQWFVGRAALGLGAQRQLNNRNGSREDIGQFNLSFTLRF